MIPADPVAAIVTVPAGDPAVLREAASTLSATAEALDGAAAAVAGLVGAAVPSAWTGSAARSCASAEERAVADCRALVRAMREAAAAVAQLAAELAEAIDDARRAAAQAADLSATMYRAASSTPSERLATEATRARRNGEAAAERARLANLTAAAAFDQITTSLPAIATLSTDCATTETRTAIDRQLAALLAQPLTATPPSDDQDATLPESLFGIGMLLAAGGAVISPAKKKGSGKRGGRGGPPAASPSGGPSSGRPPEERHQQGRARPIWSAEKAHEKALEMGFVKTNFRSDGEPVYRKGRRYISRDHTGHTSGGAWKMAYAPDKLKLKTTRLGTYNQDLTQRVGD